MPNRSKYVITNVENNNARLVILTLEQFTAIDEFIEWACLEDTYTIDTVDDAYAAEW